MVSRRRPPTFIPWMPWSHPGMTWPAPSRKSSGRPRFQEASNSSPVEYVSDERTVVHAAARESDITRRAVGVGRRNDDQERAAHGMPQESAIEPRDDFAAPDGEVRGLPAPPGRVELPPAGPDDPDV